MSHDIPDQNQHATGEAIAHLINHTPALPLLEAVAVYLKENATDGDLCFFASCVVQSLKAQHPVHQRAATINDAERIHAALVANANGEPLPCCDRHALNPDSPDECAAYTGTTDTGDGCEDTEAPTVHADGFGVPVRTCSVCGDDSADQTGECADWCGPACAEAITADDTPEYERRQKAAVRAINAAVNAGHTSFSALFLQWEFVACPTCGDDLELSSEDGFKSHIVALCDCFGEVVL